jgi:hypothetical protein
MVLGNGNGSCSPPGEPPEPMTTTWPGFKTEPEPPLLAPPEGVPTPVLGLVPVVTTRGVVGGVAGVVASGKPGLSA